MGAGLQESDDKAVQQTRVLAEGEGSDLAVSKVNQVLDQIKTQCTEVEANLGNTKLQTV